ncbi:MAG: adenylyl-sulfate kinase, partial [Pseudomonadota bacterium]
AKAARGEIKNFTGFDSPYEPPMSPEVHLNTAETSPEDLVEQIIRYLRETKRI